MMTIHPGRFLAMATMTTLLAFAVAAADPKRIEPVLEEDGIYTQPWFLKSFLDLKEDLAEARAAGKHLVVIFEQRGCPYCKRMHLENLTDPRINEFVRAKFAVLQINIHGDREVTDFDGSKMPEKHLAQRWMARFTPTLVFLAADGAMPAGKSGKDVGAFRMQGYLEPGAFFALFKYVDDGAVKAMGFEDYLRGPGAAEIRRITNKAE